LTYKIILCYVIAVDVDLQDDAAALVEYASEVEEALAAMVGRPQQEANWDSSQFFCPGRAFSAAALSRQSLKRGS